MKIVNTNRIMKNLIYLLGFIVVLSACQKVIDVDLNEANPQLVIEGNFTAEDSTVRVKISLTSSFFDTEQSPSVDNAVVTITDQQGNVSNLTSLGGGEFILLNYIPQFNTTYTMNVLYNGVNYAAECDLPNIVDLNDITFEYTPGFFGLEGGYVVYLNFQDPVAVANSYIIVLSRNGAPEDQLQELFTQDDILTDGNLVERPLFGNEFYDLGDVVGMELRSVDKQVLDYYEEAISIAGGGGGAAPANPTSNWDNDALGYFSAYGNSRKLVVIQ